jgi:hypothetical protein
MGSILPLLLHNVYKPWDSFVHASDAASLGFGVVTKVVNIDVVKVMGRQSEAWRYRVQATVNARSHALSPDILMLDPSDMTPLPDMGALHSSEGQQLLGGGSCQDFGLWLDCQLSR